MATDNDNGKATRPHSTGKERFWITDKGRGGSFRIGGVDLDRNNSPTHYHSFLIMGNCRSANKTEIPPDKIDWCKQHKIENESASWEPGNPPEKIGSSLGSAQEEKINRLLGIGGIGTVFGEPEDFEV